MKVLITGTTSGIGAEFLDYFSEFAVVHTINRRDAMVKKNVIAHIVDLKNKELLLDTLHKIGDVDLVINNAGVANFGSYFELDPDVSENIIDVNIKALETITHFFYKQMYHKGGSIINIGSIGGFFVGPNQACYYASKAFVNNFTLALQYEAKRNKALVNIFLLAPGTVKTNLFEKGCGLMGNNFITTDKLVIHTIKCLKKKKKIIFSSFTTKLLYLFRGIIPSNIIMYFLYNRQNKKN